MTTEQLMSYEPMAGDKVKFLMTTLGYHGTRAEPGEIGVIGCAIESSGLFSVNISNDRCIIMNAKASERIPHDLMHIECIEPVPTPCYNNVDVDAILKRCGDKPSCHDVELKVLTVMEMCREIRRYRLAEKERLESEE